MPITLAKIASNTSTVTLSVGEDTVTIEYYPGRVTERLVGQLQAFSNLQEATLLQSFADFNETLSTMIKSWDVLEDDGETMFPIEATRLAELPLVFRIQVVNAIVEDIGPNGAAPQA